MHAIIFEKSNINFFRKNKYLLYCNKVSKHLPSFEESAEAR